MPTPSDGPFRNRSGVDVDPRGALKWSLQRIGRRLPPPPRAPVTGVPPDLALLHGNRSEPTLTWIGHASLLLQLAGRNILIDPVFSRRVSPVSWAGPRRHQPPGLSLDDLPPIDLVVISHNHYDHLDLASVRALQRHAGGAPTFLVPTGVDAWFARRVRGATVRAFEWHDGWHHAADAGDIGFHFLPVQHWSSRSALRRNDTAWGSWAIVHPHFRFWYSGDLGYSDDPARIGAQFGDFDCAAIGIGAYEPRWFMARQHVNPDEAVQVMLDVRAAQAIGVHWGTFALADEPLDEPPRALAAAVAARGLPAEQFTVLRHGETRTFPRRAPTG